jgi:Ca-activated chloride channel family protein
LEALKVMPADGRPKMIVFLTDGEPTVGVTDISQIIRDVTNRNLAGTKIFVFGIGYDVNTYLLDKLASDNHGTAEYVVEGENIEVKVSNFYEKVDNPVLSDVSIDIVGVNTMELYPKEIPDVFKGTQVLVFGQYTGGGQADVRLTGKVGGQEKSITYRRELPSSESGNDFLPRLWATRKIGYLLETIRLEGEKQELVDEIVALAKKYGIATPYTSFLILEDEPTAQREGLRNFLAPTSGMQGVSASADIGSYKAAESAGGATQSISGPGGQATTIEYVGSKTFVERDDVLTDTDYVSGAGVRNLKYGSDAYFAALAANPVLGQYFAIGKDLIVCLNGTCVKVSEAYTGAEDEIGQMPPYKVAPPCSSDSDCELTCICTCDLKPSPIRCIRAMDCPNERGVTGCRCVGGTCAVVTDPDWAPGGQSNKTACGNGVCESGETSAGCPADCTMQPGGERPVTREERSMILELGIILIAVLVGSVLALRYWLHGRGGTATMVGKPRHKDNKNKRTK